MEWLDWRNPFGNQHWPRGTGKILGPLQLVTPPAGPPVSLAEAKLHCRVDPDVTEDDDLIAGLLTAATDYAERNIEGGKQFATATYDLPSEAFWHDTLSLSRPPLQQVVSITYTQIDGTVQTVDPAIYEVKTFYRQPGTVQLLPYQVWPIVQPWRRWPITIRFQCGYGPVTTIDAAVAAGSQTVTPDSMDGILAGTWLAIDVGQAREIVQVTATGPTQDPPVAQTTFTATFKRSHTAGVIVGPNLPETARQAIKMLVGHWYRQREAVITGTIAAAIPIGVDSLLACESYGAYR